MLKTDCYSLFGSRKCMRMNENYFPKFYKRLGILEEMATLLCLIIPILCFYFEKVFGVKFNIHQDKEISLFPGDQIEKEEFIGFCELECKHKCKKITESNGCNY